MKARAWLLPIALICSVAIASLAYAAAPSGSTGLCKDGTYTTADSKKGACSGHGGLKQWYGKAGPPNTTSPTSQPGTGSGTGAQPNNPAGAQAAGGGAGKVWVNTHSKVYHCPNDKWYGKTKEGAYMSESEAIAKGNRAAYGKKCS